MKINFVYEFESCYGKIVNGINPSYLHFLFDDDFCFQKTDISNFQNDINHIISYWKPAYLYNYDNSDECTVNDLSCFIPNELYLYPISTSGDIFEFLSLRDKKHNTPLFYISQKTKSLLDSNKNFYIYLEHPGEPYFDSDLLKEIYNLCHVYDISFNKIILVNGTNSNQFILDDFREKYDNIKKLPKLVSYNWSLPFKALELRSNLGIEVNPQAMSSTICDINHIYKEKEKKGLLLVKRLRMHRLMLLSMMFDSEIIKDTMYSLDTKMNLYDNFTKILVDEPHTLPIQNIPKNFVDKLINGYKKIIKKQKVVLDYENFETVHGFGMETKELYENTYFSIVAETEFSQYQKSITEKVLKPIMHCHPFVVLGSPNTLSQLKSYGFKTFSDFWDESYDEELDDWNRLIKVYNLIDNLTKKDTDEWSNILLKMKDILEYNKNLLTTFTSEWILEKIKNNFVNIENKNVITIL